MLTEKQLTIFTTFTKQPFKELTRQELKKASKEKSNKTIDATLTNCKKEQLLTEKKVGKSTLYKLRLESTEAIHYLSLANEKQINQTVKQAISNITTEVKKTTPFFTIAIFGSYAKKEQTATSDLDTAIIIEDETKTTDIRRNLRNAELTSLIPLDTHIITRAALVTMLTNNEENLGKQIAKKHLAIHNPHIFYDIIQEAIHHGFTS